ncbi:hypothetical protein ACU686_29430 [Yinghuangia aomiensis]
MDRLGLTYGPTGPGWRPVAAGAPLRRRRTRAAAASTRSAASTNSWPADGALLRYREHLGTLVDRHLGAPTEARDGRLRLLADFTGTTEELLASRGGDDASPRGKRG